MKQVAVTGANPHTVGTLKPPSNAYAFRSPVFECTNGGPVPPPCSGGNFWNGRAQGNEVRDLNVLGGELDRYVKYLGPTADQAHASPFINRVEQGLPDIEAVCEHVKSAKYAPLYPIAYDGALIDCDSNVVTTFARFAVALAAYQHSHEVNPFDARRDREIRGEVEFTAQEREGRRLFYTINIGQNPARPRGAGCVICHNSEGPGADGTNPDQLYSDMRYHNIGTPRNAEIPGNPEPNVGVGRINDAFNGNHKTPTLRNVDKRRSDGFKKAYTHNGWFKSLESLVHFYNTRDVKAPCDPDTTEKDALAQGCWPAAEFPTTQAPGVIVGNLQLTVDEEAAIVSYLKTLTDIPTPKAPAPFNLKKFHQLAD